MKQLLMIMLLSVSAVLHPLALFSEDSTARDLRIVRTGGAVTNLYYGSKNLTGFRVPHEIFKYETSPGGLQAFVWHEDYPPLKLSTYDLNKGVLIKEFVPGFGGDLSWTAYGDLIHYWGCGTNCVNLAIYDIYGHRKFIGYYCGLTVSPRKGYVATFPSLLSCDPAVTVYGLKTLQVVYKSGEDDDIRQISGISWKEEDVLGIEYRNSEGRVCRRTITIGNP